MRCTKKILWLGRECILTLRGSAPFGADQNEHDTGLMFADTLEFSQLYVAPIFNLFQATWIRRLP